MNRTSRSSLVLAVATICMFFLLSSMASAYMITTSTAGTGTGAFNPSGEVTGIDGSNRTFSVSTASGSKLVKLTVNSVDVWDCFEVDGEEWCYVPSVYTFTNTTGATNTIVATFESTLSPAPLATHTITASPGVNGSISPSGAVPVNYNQSQLFVINPNPGYKIATLTIDANTAGETAVAPVCDDESGACALPNTYTFTSVSANHTIDATFTATVPAATQPRTIEVNAGAGGSISPSGIGTPAKVPVVYGQDQLFLIIPNPGYKIASVVADAGGAGEIVVQQVEDDESGVIYIPNTYTFTNVTADHKIDATFAAAMPAAVDPHTITITAGVGGSISPSGEAAQDGDPKTVSVADGQSQTFVILPASGYKIDSLTVDAGTLNEIAVTDCIEEDNYSECWIPSSYVFTNVIADHTIDVTFEPTGATDPSLLTYRTIAVTVGTGGSISPPGVADPEDLPEVPDTVKVVDNGAGGDQMFYINPDPGYRIATLVADGIPVQPVVDDESGASALPNTYTFTGVTDNSHTLEVTFEPSAPAPPTIRIINASATTPSADPAVQGGIISPSGDVPVIDGEDQVFFITPYPGCELISLMVNDSPVLLESVCDEESGACGLSNIYTVTKVGAGPNSGDNFIVATFSDPPATFTVTAGVVDLGPVDGGTISHAGATEWEAGTQPIYYFAPAAGFKVAEVCVNTTCVAGPMSSYTFEPLDGDNTITVEFEAIPITYTITASAGPGGSISPKGVATVDKDDTPTFTFAPNPYYAVSNVLVNNQSVYYEGITDYTFDPVKKNQKISVSFARPIYTLTASVNGGIGGTISYMPSKKVYAGVSVTYTVKPATNYKVDRVEVDGTQVALTNNKFTLTASKDQNIVAFFSPLP